MRKVYQRHPVFSRERHAENIWLKNQGSYFPRKANYLFCARQRQRVVEQQPGQSPRVMRGSTRIPQFRPTDERGEFAGAVESIFADAPPPAQALRKA
jgi:hypothetical protein